jgi:dynein heavy chain
MHHVFSKILDRGMLGHDEVWRSKTGIVAEISVALYQRVSSVLRPTPAKSHYLFNVRQLTELMQGLLMMKPDPIKESKNKL